MSKINNPKFLVLNAVMDCGKKLHGLHKLIISRLVSYGTFNAEKNIIEDIYPAIETLATDLGVAENTVKAAIKAASNLNILSSKPDYKNGKQTTNRITIYVDVILNTLAVKRAVDKAVDNPVHKPVGKNLGGQPLGGLGGQPLIKRGSTIDPNKNREQIILKEQYVRSDTIKILYERTEQKIVEYIIQALKIWGYTGDQLRRYTDEVLFHAHNRDKIKTKSFDHAINAALKAIREGRWSTPRAMDKF